MAISAVDDWLSQGCARSPAPIVLQQRVEQAGAVVEHERPQHAGRRHRQHHRREIEAAQQRKAAPLRIQQHRHRQPQRHLEHQRAEDVEHDMHVAHQVHGVGEGPLEIGKAGPARRREPVPVGEGVVEGRAERQEHEAAEQQQGRSDEQQVRRAGGDRGSPVLHAAIGHARPGPTACPWSPAFRPARPARRPAASPRPPHRPPPDNRLRRRRPDRWCPAAAPGPAPRPASSPSAWSAR